MAKGVGNKEWGIRENRPRAKPRVPAPYSLLPIPYSTASHPVILPDLALTLEYPPAMVPPLFCPQHSSKDCARRAGGNRGRHAGETGGRTGDPAAGGTQPQGSTGRRGSDRKGGRTVARASTRAWVGIIAGVALGGATASAA